MSLKRMFWDEEAERLFPFDFGVIWTLARSWTVFDGCERCDIPPECFIHVLYKIFAMQFDLPVEFVQAFPFMPYGGFHPDVLSYNVLFGKWQDHRQRRRFSPSWELLLVLCFGLVFVEFDIAISSEGALFDVFSFFPHDVFDCDACV